MYEGQSAIVHTICIILFSLTFIRAAFSFLSFIVSLLKQHYGHFLDKIKGIKHFYHQFILILPTFVPFYHFKSVKASHNTIFNAN